MLVDVHPDGRGWNLCEGAVRARHSGPATPLVAGAVYHFTIDLIAISAVVPAGHRLRLHVSSSSFPEWEPNPNTGRPVGTDTDSDLVPPASRCGMTRATPAAWSCRSSPVQG